MYWAITAYLFLAARDGCFRFASGSHSLPLVPVWQCRSLAGNGLYAAVSNYGQLSQPFSGRLELRGNCQVVRKEQVLTQSIERVMGLIFMIAISAMVGWSAEQQRIDKRASETRGELLPQRRPLSYWLRSIRDRDDKIDLAFDAVIDLGPDAWPAVEPPGRSQVARKERHPYRPRPMGTDRSSECRGPRLFSTKISFRHVLQHHALRVEEGTVERDGVPHDVDEPVAIVVEERNDYSLQLVVERGGVAR